MSVVGLVVLIFSLIGLILSMVIIPTGAHHYFGLMRQAWRRRRRTEAPAPGKFASTVFYLLNSFDPL